MSDSTWRPDWRNKEYYPDPDNTSLRQWAWEFLRRNCEYQKDYEKLSSFEYGRKMHNLATMPQEEVRQMMDTEDFRGWATLASKMIEKYSLIKHIPCPAKDYKKGLLSLKNATTPLHTSIQREYGEGTKRAIEFDLNEPIEPQLERARQALRVFQQAMELAPKRTRHEARKFQEYLRILDAKAAGASNVEIEHVLYPDAEGDIQSRLKKGFRTAKELAHSGYKTMY